jgi:MFS family permease
MRIVRKRCAHPVQNAHPGDVRPVMRGLIMIGLVLGMCNSMIMQTLLSTTLPGISAELGTSSLYSWVYSGYVLASSVTIPLFGNLCDRFGYKSNYLLGGFLFFVATAWCALSQSMLSLVIARIAMGIGAGIVVPATYGIIGSLYAKQEFRRVFALFAVVQIVGNGAGSVLGGFFAESVGWRASIGLLLVPELVGAFLIWCLLPTPLRSAGQSKINPLNAAALTMAVLLIMLGIDQFDQLGNSGNSGSPEGSTGSDPAVIWSTLRAIVLCAAGLLSLAAFVLRERRARFGLLPAEFKTSPLLRNLSLQVFFLGALFSVSLVHIPGCLQLDGLLSAETTGLAVLLYVVSMGAGSIISGVLKIPVTRVMGAGWAACLLGVCFFLVPMPLIARLMPSLALLGMGCGLLSTTLLGHIAAQAEQNRAGVNSFGHMIRNFGGSIAVVAFTFTLDTGIISLYLGLAALAGMGGFFWQRQNRMELQANCRRAAN